MGHSSSLIFKCSASESRTVWLLQDHLLKLLGVMTCVHFFFFSAFKKLARGGGRGPSWLAALPPGSTRSRARGGHPGCRVSTHPLQPDKLRGFLMFPLSFL
eukprot:bmy_20530T0